MAVSEHSNVLGERLRAAREQRRIGVRELSRRLDVSASMISQIERGHVMPSVNTLYAITSTLGISLDALFAPAEPERDGTAAWTEDREAAPAASTPVERSGAGTRSPVVRRAEAQTLTLASGVRWELLTAEPDSAVDFLRTTYLPGSESTPADGLMRHNGHEYGTVIEGTLGVTVGFETYELQVGDSISFDSSTPHRLFNAGDVPAVAIWVVVGRGGDMRTGSR